MYLKATVIADSKVEKIEKIKDEVYKIFVKQPAENNLANKRVLEIVKNFPECVGKRVKIISGHQKSSKKFEVM